MYAIYLAKVRFEDSAEYKKRPVLLLYYKNGKAVCRKVTSQPVITNYPGEVELLDWNKEGLRKPSVVRMSKHFLLDKSDLIHKIGNLTQEDNKTINQKLKTPYKESFNSDDELGEYFKNYLMEDIKQCINYV